MPPTFLDLAEVIEIHRDQIERYGGHPGLRDTSLLESAIAVPQATFGGEYLHGDLFDMAAASLFHMVQDHPCLDGNKRVGTVAALVFLALNGVEVRVTAETLVETVLAVAQGKIKKDAIAEFLRRHARD